MAPWRAIVLISLLLTPLPALGDGPRVPCAATEPLAYPSPEESPHVRVWFREDMARDWRPPDCLDWSDAAPMFVVETRGTLSRPGGSQALLSAFIDTDAMGRAVYWSISDERWRRLLSEAHTITPEGEPRPDHAPDRLDAGDTFYLFQDNNRPGSGVKQRHDILERGADRLVIDSLNVTPSEVLMAQLLPKKTARNRWVLTRDSGDTWHYWHLSRVEARASSLMKVPRASLVNRMTTLFRLVAGTPTRSETPPAPGPDGGML